MKFQTDTLNCIKHMITEKSLYREKGMVPLVQSSPSFGLGCLSKKKKISLKQQPILQFIEKCTSRTIPEGFFLGTFRTNSWEPNFSRAKIFQDLLLELTIILLLYFCIWSSELSSKFSASIIEDLVLSFRVKVVSNVVSSAD